MTDTVHTGNTPADTDHPKSTQERPLGRDTIMIGFCFEYEPLKEHESPVAIRVQIADGRKAVLSWKYDRSTALPDMAFGYAYRVFLDGEKLQTLDGAEITGVCINSVFVHKIRSQAFSKYYDELLASGKKIYDVIPGSLCDEPWVIKQGNTDRPVDRTDWVTMEGVLTKCQVGVANPGEKWVILKWAAG